MSRLFCLPLILFFLLNLVSCSQDKSEEVDSAILAAQISLNSGDCQGAIDTLNEVGYQESDALYLRTYAAAYACRAGYSTPTFIGSDLSLFGSPSTFGGNARFSTSSSMDDARNSDYEDMWVAIDALLFAGGIPLDVNPTVSRRTEKFGSGDLSDIHTFALYLSLVQLGKYLFFYGNSSSSGVKGAGSQSNFCLANYSNVAFDNNVAGVGNIQNYLNTVPTGLCVFPANGHSQLGSSGNLSVQRMCEGVVIVNNILSLLPVVLASSTSSDLSGLNGADALIEASEALLTTASTTAADTVVDVLGRQHCESLNSASTDDLELFFILFFETLFT